MPKVLYIGGSGEISFACVEAAVNAGQEVSVFNRGVRGEVLPAGVEHIVGDIHDDAAYTKLASRHFDTICQFIALTPATVNRDIEIFAGNCGQYLFVSSASAYQKPCTVDVITEQTPLENPFWEYSRLKASCESLLLRAHSAGTLPVTIVRPSHTYRTRLPGTCIPGDHMAWRMLQGKAVPIHDDGESLWTLTHADDFARAFIALCDNKSALGEAFNITRDSAYTWNEIVANVASVLECSVEVAHIATDTLIGYRADWLGPLKGDKANSVVFDNSKVASVVGGWQCEIGLLEGLRSAAKITLNKLAQGYSPDAELDALIDRIVAEHAG